MNILNILDEIEKVDGEIYERLSPRRSAMKDFYNMGKKVSLAALPLAIGSMFTKAYGQSNPANVTQVLQFALALEWLEFHFYNHTVVGKTAGSSVTDVTFNFPTGGLEAITTIRNHEDQHVKLLKGALKTDAFDLAYADFDFRAGGTLANVYSDYETYLRVALAFEDTGVRAYKGQAPLLKGMPVLQTALQIHSVEARHAAHIRTMLRAQVPSSNINPWIGFSANGNDTGFAGVDAVYAGEQNTKVKVNEKGDTIEITGINATAVSQTQAAASFDEFLTGSDVKKIANLFIRDPKKLS